jgi:MoaA/NifB/PqqE/SkfB family radical SAM enzyme
MKFSPTYVYYMITTQCNQRCTKCSHWKNQDCSDRLDTSLLVKSLRQLPAVKELCIVGGEPLLFKDEVKTILDGLSSSQGVRTTIITNGVEMDPGFIEKVSKRNVHIVVSIDTMDREMWKYIRGCDSFDTVMSNLDYAVSTLHPSQISIQSVLAKETQPFVGAVAEFAKEKKIYHSIQNYVREGFNGTWTPVQEHTSEKQSPYDKCYAAGRNLSIMQNGDIYTCFQQGWIKGCAAPIGNLNEDDTGNILRSDYTLSVLNKMKTCSFSCKVLKCNTQGENEV